MVKVIKAETIEKDDDLAILKKVISLPNNFCFSTPTRSIKSSMQKDSLRSDSIINEVVKRVDINFLESLEEGATSRVTREIRASCLTNKLNLVIFDLIFDTVPNETLIRTLAQQIYSSSDICIFLPTVRKALFSEIPQFRKTPKFSDRKFGKYLDMMETIINDIIEVGNNKPFIGTIPFIPIKYARQIINLYYQKGITSFAIDANTRDVLSNEADLRDILSEINRKIRLPDAFIYACNLGYPRYDDLVARADDFLSIFAYIDVMGGTF